MSERAATRNPTVIVGSPVSGQGGPNTGQLSWTQGGQRIHFQSSGAAAAQIWPGAGRVNSVQLIGFAAAAPAAASGVPYLIYDGAVAGAGFSQLSGHRLLAKADPRTLAINNPSNSVLPLFNSGMVMYDGPTEWIGRPFSSGLNIQGASGACGIVIDYTPVVSGTNPNA